MRKLLSALVLGAALELLRAQYEHALATLVGKAPADLSVIGYDDIDLSAYAGLTTIRQPLFDSGYLGARLLLDALEAGTLPTAEVTELPIELVPRSTTAVPARGAA